MCRPGSSISSGLPPVLIAPPPPHPVFLFHRNYRPFPLQICLVCYGVKSSNLQHLSVSMRRKFFSNEFIPFQQPSSQPPSMYAAVVDHSAAVDSKFFAIYTTPYHRSLFILI